MGTLPGTGGWGLGPGGRTQGTGAEPEEYHLHAGQGSGVRSQEVNAPQTCAEWPGVSGSAEGDPGGALWVPRSSARAAPGDGSLSSSPGRACGVGLSQAHVPHDHGARSCGHTLRSSTWHVPGAQRHLNIQLAHANGVTRAGGGGGMRGGVLSEASGSQAARGALSTGTCRHGAWGLGPYLAPAPGPGPPRPGL